MVDLLKTNKAKNEVVEQFVEISDAPKVLEKLDKGSKNPAIIEKINGIIEKLNNFELNSPKIRDRGPSSQRDMTDDDARRISAGDLKAESHKAAATALGLSYGQIYSSRKGFTFKNIYQENLKAK